mgnify:FL=1
MIKIINVLALLSPVIILGASPAFARAIIWRFLRSTINLLIIDNAFIVLVYPATLNYRLLTWTEKFLVPGCGNYVFPPISIFFSAVLLSPVRR